VACRDLFLVVAAWCLLAIAFVGIGLLVRRMLATPVTEAKDLWLTFWLGWAATLALLQLWHLLQPVRDLARLLVLALAVAGLLVGGRRPWSALLRRLPRHPWLLAGWGLATIWLANHALHGPRFGDSGMYFIPKIVWIEAFAVVPGLANLFVPLGHNQSFLLYSALLDTPPFVDRSYHITNSLLVWVLAARSLLGCERLLRRLAVARAADLFYALMLPAVTSLALSLFFTSPSPDLAVGILGILLSGEVMAWLELPAGPQPRFAVYALVLMASAAFTVKLSIAGLSLALVPVAVLLWYRREQPSPPAAVRLLGRLLLLGALVVVPWIVSNLIVSGCPLYPSKWLALPVDWTTKLDAVGWIQRPMEIHLRDLWHDPGWFHRRLITLGWSERSVLDALWVSAAALGCFVPLRLWRWWRRRPSGPTTLLLLPTVVSFGFCFLQAPMPRYQGATLWIFAAQLIVLGIGLTVLRGRWPARAAAVLLILAATLLPFFRGTDIFSPLTQFEIAGRVPVDEVRLPSGLVVNVPRGSDACWDAPLPCTPEPHPGLRLRRKGDLASGFAIDLAVPDQGPAGAR
jgi:hypothetical protein